MSAAAISRLGWTIIQGGVVPGIAGAYKSASRIRDISILGRIGGIGLRPRPIAAASQPAGPF